MVFCRNCGTELSDAANFCSNCGVKTAKGVEANVSMPYREVISDMEKQLEKAAVTASEEVRNAFNRAKEEIRKAANR